MDENAIHNLEALGSSRAGQIHVLTIVGQVEGHQLAPETAKTTKYEHVLPLLAGLEQSDDIDGILENVVYNELNYRYNDVAILSVGGYEVDFVCDFTQKPKYFQVCYSLNGESTLNREVRPFSLIKDNYPKTIITYERYPLDDIDGIRVVNVIDWLLEKEQSI